MASPSTVHAHLATLERALAARGIRSTAIIMPPGEKTKSYQHLAELCDKLLAAGQQAVSMSRFRPNIVLGNAPGQQAVVAHQADLGIAFDGDGDRVIMVDHLGNVVDGDEILYVLARQRQLTGSLRGPVVGTVMSNFGLQQAFEKLGIPFERAAVGDRYVLERLRASNGVVGGETSGHTICLDRSRTGDGIVTALQVLEAMLMRKQTLAELVGDVSKLPQVLLNVPVTGKAKPLLDDPAVKAVAQGVEASLVGRGRLLLRASGTEPVVRVMVEATEHAVAVEAAERLAETVRAAAAAR